MQRGHTAAECVRRGFLIGSLRDFDCGEERTGEVKLCWTGTNNDPTPWLVIPNHTTNLSVPVLGRIEADYWIIHFCNKLNTSDFQFATYWWSLIGITRKTTTSVFPSNLQGRREKELRVFPRGIPPGTERREVGGWIKDIRPGVQRWTLTADRHCLGLVHFPKLFNFRRL